MGFTNSFAKIEWYGGGMEKTGKWKRGYFLPLSGVKEMCGTICRKNRKYKI